MSSLETFVRTKLASTLELIEGVQHAITACLRLFESIDFDAGSDHESQGKVRGWRYWVSEDDKDRNLGSGWSNHLSQSTSSMIVAALLATIERRSPRYAHSYAPGLPSWQSAPDLNPALRNNVKAVILSLIQRWEELQACQMPRGTASSTFGSDDLLTMSWHFDIFLGPSADTFLSDEAQLRAFRKSIASVVSDRIVTLTASHSEIDTIRHLFNSQRHAHDKAVSNSAYLWLRAVRLLKALKQSEYFDPAAEENCLRFLQMAQGFFQRRLNEQITHSQVDPASCDVAELVFCFEGVLCVRSNLVDETFARTILTIVRENLSKRGDWRSATPILSDQKGFVLFPIRVETATSLVCALSHLRKHLGASSSEAVSHEFIDVLEGFWAWIRNRQISVQSTATTSGRKVTGWKSEHIPGLVIHSWETSQILEFLIIFQDFMKQHLGSRLAIVSRLKVEPPRRKKKPWGSIEDVYENSLGMDLEWQAYNRIGKDFIEPRLTGLGEPQWSMILSGPPGTGKTTLARSVSAALGARLITVSVGDFLTSGVDLIEMQARLVFDVLTYQDSVVVLFDELDQFLLDRGSDRGDRQDSAFQALVPAMLTKFADLRNRQSVLFMLATNFEDRIDAAIKRRGRFDRVYVVLPPSLEKRKRIIVDRFSNLQIDPPAEDQLRELAEASLFLGFAEIRAVLSADSIHGGHISKLLNIEPRSLSLGDYTKRILNSDDGTRLSGPLKEFSGLVKMALEIPDASEKNRFKSEIGRIVNAKMNGLLSDGGQGYTIAQQRKLLVCEGLGLSDSELNRALSW